jgi:hypothetical protein
MRWIRNLYRIGIYAKPRYDEYSVEHMDICIYGGIDGEAN